MSDSKRGQSRSSVSAEAYGAWNVKKTFVPPKYAKTEAQKQRIRGVLKKSFLFNAVEVEELEIVIDAMKEKNVSKGQTIINQGDDGDLLYVIEQGRLDCFKKIGSAAPKLVKTCEPGDTFGELALLYNTPRAASVKSATDCVLWELDRETFNMIVRDAASKKRERYESFLKSVPIFKNMDAYELSQVADALKPETHGKNEQVVRQGDPGDKFYVLESGSCEAHKAREGKVEKVMDYMPGDYFGELALLRNEPRAATILTNSPVKLLVLDRRSFERLLGPLQSILNRATDKYR